MLHGTRSRFALAVGSHHPTNSHLCEVDIFLANIWLTCDDNSAFVPQFTFNLDATIEWLLSTGPMKSPYPDQPAEQVHRLLDAAADGSVESCRFMQWGPTTDNITAFIFRGDETVYITASFHRPTHPRPEELGRVFHAEIPERELILILHRAARDLRGQT
jgi:hypothetical protein